MDGGANGTGEFTNTEEEFLGVLRQEAGASLKVFRLAMSFRFNGNGGADGVMIALLAAQSKGNRVADAIHYVAKNAELRRVAILENHFEVAIAVEVGKRKGASILEEIQSHHTGNVRERTVAIVG